MSITHIATFIAKIHPTPAPEDPIVYLCVTCDPEVEVPAMETDIHASRKHKAGMIRVFEGPAAYQNFLHEQKIRQAIKEMP